MSDLKKQFAAIRASRKFAAEDAEYLSARKVFARDIGYPDLFTHVDQFGVYCGPQTLASRIVAYEALKRSVSVPGHVMEFGVWHGSNLLFMAKLLRLMQSSTTKLLFGFENFTGLPPAHSFDGAEAGAAAGRYKGNELILRAAMELYHLQDWVHLVVGDATQTVPAFEAEFPEAMVSLAWVDFDLYEPTRVALQFLGRRLARGGIVILDEAISQAWPGETVALLEFLAETGFSFDMEANVLGRQPVMMLVRKS